MYRSLSKLQTGYFFMFYFYLPNLENRKPAIWRHLISCVCFSVEQRKWLYFHHKLYIVLKKFAIELPCMLDMYGFIFFIFVLEDVPFSPPFFIFGRMTPACHS